MVAFFPLRKQIFVLSYMIILIIIQAQAAPTISDTTKLIKRADFFIPPPSNANYAPPKYRPHTPVQTHKPTPIIKQQQHHNSDRAVPKESAPSHSAKSRWTGMGEMRKSSLKRTGSKQDLWWQGSAHDSEATHKRTKNENTYKFRDSK